MKRLFLLAVYKYHRFYLWLAEINHDGAQRVVGEANTELDRAMKLAEHTRAELTTAQENAQRAGYHVLRHDRLKALGVHP